MPDKIQSGIKSGIIDEIKLQEPKMFVVLMFNDDFTTMEFVTEILIRIFHKSEQEADSIMLTVHNEGKAVVGEYTYDMAVTKKAQTDLIANEKGFPLKLTIDMAE